MQPREEIYPHLEALADRGVLEFVDLQPLFAETERRGADPMAVYYKIVNEMDANSRRAYAWSDVQPLYDYLQIDPAGVGAKETLATASVFLAALSLQPVAAGVGLPCVDSPFLFDLIACGMKGLFAPAMEARLFTPAEVQALQALFLGQRTLALYLPSFELRSFDDVFELRGRLKDQIGAFRERMGELSGKIDALPWEREFKDQVETIVKTKLDPEVADLRAAARFAPSKIAGKMTVAGAVVSLNALFPEWFGQWVLGSGGLALWEAIKHERERSQKVRTTSAFSFLLEVRRELGSD